MSCRRFFEEIAWIVPEIRWKYRFEELLYTWEWLELLKYIWAIYRRPDWGFYCRLASWQLSDTYINIAASERNHLILERAWSELSQKLSEKNIKADVVMWAQMWSIRLSSYLAEKMWVESSIYTEKTWPKDAEMALKRHDIDLQWKNVVLSEDIVTKWSTLEKMIEIVEAWWWTVVAITCVWNRYWKDNFNWIPLISCFVPPAFNMFYDEKTLEIVHDKMQKEWKTEEEILVEAYRIRHEVTRLPEWSDISEKPKNEWTKLVESMR
jgi:orotate phosphoribosyltransferase